MKINRQPASWRDWESVSACVVAGLLLLALASTCLPSSAVPRCPFKVVTGIPCFTCGTFRALCAWRAGDIRLAFRMQPLISLMGLVACFWVLYGISAPLFRVPRVRMKVNMPWVVAAGFGVLVLANWIYLIAAGR